MRTAIPFVTTTDAAGFPTPSGTKLSTNRCSDADQPQGCRFDGPSESQYPILIHEGYTFWPLAYNDDRSSFAIVVTADSSADPVKIFEVQGARYIDSIEVSFSNESVTLVGQGFRAASIPWSALSTSAMSRPSTNHPSSHRRFTTDFEDELDAGIVAGISAGCVVGVMGTVIILWLMYRSKVQRRSRSPSVNSVDSVGSNPNDAGLGTLL
jgi:hypothetical protein